MVAEGPLQQQLRVLFAEELADGLEVLVPGLLRLEQHAGQDPDADLVRDLFRTAHSLKGAAHAAVIPEALGACDRLESALAAVRNGDQAPDAALISRLLTETDALAAVAANLQGGAVQTAPRARSVPEPRRPAPSSPTTPEEPSISDPDPGVRAEAGAGSAPPVGQPPASVRVTTEKVEALLRHAGEGVAVARLMHDVVQQAEDAAQQVDAARSRLRAAMRQIGDQAPGGPSTLLDDAVIAVAALARSVEATNRAMHHASSGSAEAVQRLRTQPFADACGGFQRVVRDIATSTQKSAHLTVEGGDIDVDRTVIAALRDPLLHVVRNAVDHGLETPEVRQAAGKPAEGTVAVVATLVGSLLHVTVRDDGAGIDMARLRQVAAQRGIAAPAEDAELVFVPGLSSSADVTAVSGRGVGLDAARARLEQLGGSLQLRSTPGTGTEVRLTTPVSRAVLRVLLVSAGGQVVALPTSSVGRVALVERREVREVDGQSLLTLGRRTVKAVSLAVALGFPRGAAPATGDRLGVVVPEGGDVVLVTDGLLDEVEVALRPAPERLRGVPGVLGVTATAGGLPAVVINPVAVGRRASPFTVTDTAPAPVASPRILLAEDTVTTRALERSILEAAGYDVAVAVDGADAWEQLQANGADLVVSDVDMPRMSGIDLCRRIRSSPQLRELPVVLVTSLDSAADRRRGMDAGADAYVVKAEFQQGALIDTIGRLL